MVAENKQLKTLLFFGPTRLSDALDKGNVWYVRHYEAYFDKVYVAYLSGGSHAPASQGKTVLTALAGGNRFLNLALAPYRLYRFARQTKPTVYLTADMPFSWWSAFLVRSLLGAKIFLMPVCLPWQIYKNSEKSVSGYLPIWLEKIFIKLSFLSASRAITGKNIKIFVDWLSSLNYAKNKLFVVDVIPEELPSFEFYEALKNYQGKESRGNEEFKIIYVGRFYKEKMVEDLVKMMAEVGKKGIKARLQLIGEGPEKGNLENLATKIDARKQIDFLGFKKSNELVDYYKNADVFVSTLAGTSLREAALCGLPVIAYNIDWLRGFLVNEENALLVNFRDTERLANQVIRVLTDKPLREKITDNIHKLALEWWGPQKVAASLKQAFEDK